MKEKMNELYQTNITDGKWIAYDIPGNVGWLMYGGLGGTIISLVIILFHLTENQDVDVCFAVMGVGAILCMIFGRHTPNIAGK